MHKTEVRQLWSEQSALSLADWFVKMESAISHIFFPFFFFERRWGAERAKQEVFSKPVNSTFSSQAQKFLLFVQKKDKQVPFMSAMSSWKCHSFVTKEQSMPGVCSFKRSLNSNKRKIFTSGRGRRQRAGVEEAKFRWQTIAVAVCPIMVLPLLALTHPIKERKPRVKTAILLLIDPTGPDKTHLFTFAPFIKLEHSG